MRKKSTIKIPLVLFIILSTITIIGLFFAIGCYIHWIITRYHATIFASNESYIRVFIIILIVLSLLFLLDTICYYLYKYSLNDLELQNNCLGENNVNTISFNILKIAKNSKLILSMLMFVTMLSTTFISCVFSFKQNFNDECITYNRLFRANNEYIMQLNKSDGLVEKEVKTISELFGDNDIVCSKYKYEIKLESMIDKDYKYESKNYNDSIKKICPIYNFNKFNQILTSGRKPQNTNEVLIYDYIEDIILSSISQSTNTFRNKSVIGMVLHDYINDVSFIISGVLKSNYTNFVNTLDKKATNKYVNDLCTIYCSYDAYSSIQTKLFDGIYLLLSKDWDENFKYLEAVYKTNKYSIDTVFDTFIEEEKLYDYSSWYVAPSVVLVFIQFATSFVLLFINLEKLNFRKKTNFLCMLFVTETLIILSCLMSIPISNAIMIGYNDDKFINGVYYVGISSILYSILINIGIFMLSFLSVYVIEMVNHRKKSRLKSEEELL